MKILRIRRGYTTNSSSYTEWLPPEPAGQAGTGATPPPPSQPAATPASVARPATTASGATASAGNVQSTPATMPATMPATAPQAAPTQATSQLAGNSLLVGGVAVAMAVVFVVERIFRRLRGKQPVASDDDE